MKGYTRKVGLRKSPLHFDALRLRRTVRQVWTDDDFTWAAEHLNECRQPQASLDAALADWRTTRFPHRFPPDIVVYEDDTHNDDECLSMDPTLCAGHDPDRQVCPHCPCTQTTECCYCDGTRTPLEDS